MTHSNPRQKSLPEYKNHDFLLEGQSLSDLQKKYGSPLYVYSEKTIRENARRLKNTLAKYFPKYFIQYAVKANPNPHILKILQEEGMGADCSSPLELNLVKRLGFSMDKSTYTGNFEKPEDFQAAIESGILLNLDDGSRLEDVLQFARPNYLSFRINPGVGNGQFEGIITGGKNAKFGIPFEKTAEVYAAAKKAGVQKFGIHMMTGSNILDASYFSEITTKLFQIIEKHLVPLGIQLDLINIGGGLGVPYRPEEQPLDIDLALSQVAEIFHQEVKRLNLGNPALAMEPGRYLVANSGYVVCKATHIKKSYRNYLGTDAGMTTLARPAIYGAYHHVEVASSGKKEKYFVCGQICENTDIYPEERSLNEARPGDLVLIHEAGAYGHTMASTYNFRTRPAEVLVRENAEPQLIRKPESEKDLYHLIPDFHL